MRVEEGDFGHDEGDVVYVRHHAEAVAASPTIVDAEADGEKEGIIDFERDSGWVFDGI